MNNWKTTLIGLLTAGAYTLQDVLQKGVSLTDWKTWLVPVGIALIGYLAKDKPATP